MAAQDGLDLRPENQLALHYARKLLSYMAVWEGGRKETR